MAKVESKVLKKSIVCCMLMHKFETIEEAEEYLSTLQRSMPDKTLKSNITND